MLKKTLVMLIVLSIAGVASADVVDSISGLQLWLEADTLTLGEGAAVSTWTSTTPSTRYGSQATPADQPTYTASGIQGLPSVRFAGGDVLDILDDGGGPSDLYPGDGSAGWTSFAVTTIAPQNTMGLVVGTETGRISHMWDMRAASQWLIGYYSFQSPPPPPAVQITLPIAGLDTTAVMSWVRGDDVSANATVVGDGLLQDKFGVQGTDSLSWTIANIAMSHTGWEVGGRQNDEMPFTGDISEVIVYDRALSNSEVDQVEAYLINKYSLPEPATMVLLGVGGVLTLLRRRRRLA